MSKKTTTGGGWQGGTRCHSLVGEGLEEEGREGQLFWEFSFTLQIMPDLRALSVEVLLGRRRLQKSLFSCKAAFLNDKIYIKTYMCNHIKFNVY